MADELFIDDGYTRTHDIAAVPGLHPAVSASYRPALSKERTAYSAKLATRDADQIEKFECDLIVRHAVALNGTAVTRPLAAKLVPSVRSQVIDLILGYTPAQELADAKNS